MRIFLGFLFWIIQLLLSYFYVKTYQLDGYQIEKFLDHALTFRLAYGKKNRLKMTKRMWRFVVMFSLVLFALNFCNFMFVRRAGLIIFNLLVIYILTPIILCLVHFVLLPVEEMIKAHYKHKTKKILSSSKCIRIGITGSYGKTSTKNILKHILEKEFKVRATYENYNTPMGIAKSVIGKLDDEDVFIAEMGARHPGDIKELCQIVCPQYCILTTIGLQHVETFGSLENIEQTKNELVKFSPQSSICVFNGDSASNVKLYSLCTKDKFLTNVYGSYAYSEDVKASIDGSNFVLVLDKQRLKVKTKLLGKANIDNIVCASALAYILGVSKEDIVAAIATLPQTAHRLEIIKSQSMTIIDDAYNSNEVGFKEALKVLSLFEGRKILVTPGIVEMGQMQSQINFKLGAMAADVVDYLIIMNETNKNSLLSGAISHNFPQKNMFFANTRDEQKSILQKITCKDCVVLFENDLPDNFI